MPCAGRGRATAPSRWRPCAVPPKVTAEELDRVRSEFADVAVSGPVTVTANGKSFAIAPQAFAPAIVLAPDASGTITPRADPKKLAAVVHAAAEKAGVEVEAKDAVVTFAGRTPTVRPHVAGVALDDASIAARGLEGHLDDDAHRHGRHEDHRAEVHDRDREGDPAQGEDLVVHHEVPGRPAAGAQHQAGLEDHQRHLHPAGRAVQHERHPR